MVTVVRSQIYAPKNLVMRIAKTKDDWGETDDDVGNELYNGSLLHSSKINMCTESGNNGTADMQANYLLSSLLHSAQSASFRSPMLP